jgi:hypothetical protein
MTAVDDVGNESSASQLVTGRAFDVSPPAPAQWQSAEFIKVDEFGNEHPWADAVPGLTPAIKLRWLADDPAYENMVQRKQAGARMWQTTAPFQAGRVEYRDDDVVPGSAYEYRVRTRKANGQASLSPTTLVQGVA